MLKTGIIDMTGIDNWPSKQSPLAWTGHPQFSEGELSQTGTKDHH